MTKKSNKKTVVTFKTSQTKIDTGVMGLDEVLMGGVNTGSSILVLGAPGTGKSIFALQFALEGVKNNEPSLLILAEESFNMLKQNAKNLGLDVENKNLFFVGDHIGNGQLKSLEAPLKLIREKKIKRVALDSLSLFRFLYTNKLEFRNGVLDFIGNMRNLGVTLLATAEAKIDGIDLIEHDSAHFLFDGLIVLAKIRKGCSHERCLMVSKMRGQEHLLDIFPFKIKKGGIEVYPDQVPFSLVEYETKQRQK